MARALETLRFAVPPILASPGAAVLHSLYRDIAQAYAIDTTRNNEPVADAFFQDPRNIAQELRGLRALLLELGDDTWSQEIEQLYGGFDE